MQFRSRYIIFVFFLPLLISSCVKDSNSSDYYLLNKEVYSNLQQNYLWYNNLKYIDPSRISDPQKYLDSVVYKKYDHWSFIEKESDFYNLFYNTTYYGYGFSFNADQDGNLRIAFVYKNSDMYPAGVRRGWIIKKINNTSVDKNSSVSNLLGPNQAGVTNTFVFQKPDGNQVEMSFSKKQVQENQILFYDTIQLQNETAGYMVFNGFIGTAKSELATTFTYFKNNNVKDLILDLRYNGGGDLELAKYLSSLISGISTNGKPFIKLTFNDKNQNQDSTYYFRADPQSLNLSRLFVITTNGTASASESVINGLRPYMNVYLIGSKTDGKPVGMVSRLILSYVLVAINFKVTNATGYGDYYQGLAVDKEAPDDVTHAFGDRNEACLHQALYFIQTGAFDNQKAAPVIPSYNHNWKGLHQLIEAY